MFVLQITAVCQKCCFMAGSLYRALALSLSLSLLCFVCISLALSHSLVLLPHDMAYLKIKKIIMFVAFSFLCYMSI